MLNPAFHCRLTAMSLASPSGRRVRLRTCCHRVWVLAPLLSLLTACGSTDDDDGTTDSTSSGGENAGSGASTSGGGTSTGGTDGSGAGGSTGGSSATAGAGGSIAGGTGSGGTGAANNPFGVEPGEGEQVGSIVAGAYLSGPGGQDSLNVHFSSLEDSPSTSTCTSETIGACTVSTCTFNGDTSPETPFPDAGRIVITSDGEFSAVAEPTGDRDRYEYVVTGIFGGGEQLTVSADGGDIEAFAGEFTLPLAPLLTSPEAPPGDERRVSVIPLIAGEEFSFSWDARGSADALILRTEVNLSTEPGVPAPRVSCTFPANDGRGVIDAALTAPLTSGSEIHVYAYTVTPLQLTDGWLALFGFYEMVTPDKMASPKFVVE